MSKLDEIKKASNGKLVLCFAGVGSAFAKKNAQTSLIIAKKGTTVLVDCGTTIPTELAKQGINIWDFGYYHFTHSHADHIGGVEELLILSRYIAKRKPKFIITEQQYKILWDDTLRGGCEHNEDGLLKFSDLIETVRPSWVQAEPREMYQISIPTEDKDDPLHLKIFRTAHIPGGVKEWERAFWSTGLLIDNNVVFSGDTRYDDHLLLHLGFTIDKLPKAIFHDCQLFEPGAVHASIAELRIMSPEAKKLTHLVHYGDNFDTFDLGDEFAGFAKGWEVYKF